MIETILLAAGIPSAIFGLIIWRLKYHMEKRDKRRDEHEKDMEQLIIMILQSTRANTMLCKATAEAVRDGHCNGNMTAALEIVEKAVAAEKEFLVEKSIKYIFE